jgi:hypothetical protein
MAFYRDALLSLGAELSGGGRSTYEMHRGVPLRMGPAE